MDGESLTTRGGGQGMVGDERTTPLEETLDPADWESAGIAVVSGTSLGGN
jgi:hypothetical protein